MITWYGLCLFFCALSIAVFVLGQYGVWRLWTDSKKEAVSLLDQICAIKTQQCEQLQLKPSINSKEIEDIQKDVDFLGKLADDLNGLAAITYTSSSIFKIATVNFLSFGPVLLELWILSTFK